MKAVTILGIAGSLRRASFNRALLTAIGEQLPEGAHLALFDALGEVPLFNEDVEASVQRDEGLGVVKELWGAIRGTGAVLFATPEYNQSVPGVLKNAIDWVTRDPAGSPLAGKPVAVIGATAGAWGTRIAQQQLRTILQTCGAIVMPQPSLYVARAHAGGPPDSELRTFAEGVARWASRSSLSP